MEKKKNDLYDLFVGDPCIRLMDGRNDPWEGYTGTVKEVHSNHYIVVYTRDEWGNKIRPREASESRGNIKIPTTLVRTKR